MAIGLRAMIVGSVAAALEATAFGTPATGSGAVDLPPTQTRIAVSVATLWTAPDSPRPLDALAVSSPVDPAGILVATCAILGALAPIHGETVGIFEILEVAGYLLWPLWMIAAGITLAVRTPTMQTVNEAA
jgi:hypothetical protein